MTIARNVRGVAYKGIRLIPVADITIRATSDNKGESISLAYNDVLLMVPYAEIEKTMKAARKQGNR